MRPEIYGLNTLGEDQVATACDIVGAVVARVALARAFFLFLSGIYFHCGRLVARERCKPPALWSPAPAGLDYSEWSVMCPRGPPLSGMV